MITSELIRLLQELDPDGDREVRLAIQPSWPFEYSISSVVSSQQSFEEYMTSDTEGLSDDEMLVAEEDAPQTDIIYIGEGHQIGYLPIAARKGLEWA